MIDGYCEIENTRQILIHCSCELVESRGMMNPSELWSPKGHGLLVIELTFQPAPNLEKY